MTLWSLSNFTSVSEISCTIKYIPDRPLRCCKSKTIENCQYGHLVIYIQLCDRNKTPDFWHIFLEHSVYKTNMLIKENINAIINECLITEKKKLAEQSAY